MSACNSFFDIPDVQKQRMLTDYNYRIFRGNTLMVKKYDKMSDNELRGLAK